MITFVDTSALYATLAADDEHHEQAAAAWRTLVTSAEPLVTTNYVMVETLALAQSRLGMNAVRAVVDDITAVLSVEWIEPDDHRNAVVALLAAGRRKLSLVDCSSFEVMRRLAIRRAFAFDQHFEEQGFEMVC